MPFSGNPRTEWVVNNNGDDRDMKLLEQFSYTDPNGRNWVAPVGSIINGASIPQPLWTAVGSPYTGDYRRASIVHDVACDNVRTAQERKDADEMFYYACLDGGCSHAQANILYVGVRIGAWAGNSFIKTDFSLERNSFNPSFTLSVDEKYIQNKFQDIANQIVSDNNQALSIQELDLIINQHIKI